MTEPQVFLSYDRTDQAIAEQVRARLVANHVKTWMDRYDIPAGAYWPEKIDAGLNQSTLVVGLLSPDAVTSRNVKNEWDWAIQNDKPLLLLRIRPCVIPHRYVDINYIDAATHGLEPALAELLRIPGLQSAPKVFAAPRTERVTSGDHDVAYQAFGEGDVDLAYLPGSPSAMEHGWKLPAMAAFLRRLASFARVILHDADGTGAPEQAGRIATLEERMADVRAVMDACQSTRAVVFGATEDVPLAALFAATCPERTRALILYGGRAAYTPRQDYPWPAPLERQQRDIAAASETIDATWGTKDAARAAVQSMAPSAEDDEALVTWLAESQRIGTSPGAELARRRMTLEIDVRRVLSAVQAPTLVLHRTVDLETNIGESRYIADHIPGATFEELPGVDHLIMVGDQEPVIAAVERFVRGLAGDEAASRPPAAKWATLVWSEAEGAAPEEVLEAAQRASERRRGGSAVRVGDGVAAVFAGATGAIRYADALADALASQHAVVRSGAQAGVLEIGEREVAGPPLETARRLADMALPGQIVVTDQVRALVAGSGMRFAPASPGDGAITSDVAAIFLVDRDSLP
jgi:pimeloyl-ACP methyl ester carboxylesterase